MFRLGYMYENAQGVKKDNKRALSWYLKASKYDNIDAQLRAGVFYENGTGVTQNHKLAMEYYQKAAEQNSRDAQFNIGWMFYDGKGVLQNYKTAIQWFIEADKQGHPQAKIFIAKAMKRSGSKVDALDYMVPVSGRPSNPPPPSAVQQGSPPFGLTSGNTPDLAEIERLKNQYTRILTELHKTEDMVRRLSTIDISGRSLSGNLEMDVPALPMLIEDPIIMEKDKPLYEEPVFSESLVHDEDPDKDIIFDSQGEEDSTNGDLNYDSSDN
ncbi:HCP-like protein [Backusella circina FSU 941]|nr:HCP-like protein [Backusella circina FSU 941]